MSRRPGLGLSCLALAALAACSRTADPVAALETIRRITKLR